jgi:Xaa-Pro aminopeptidase
MYRSYQPSREELLTRIERLYNAVNENNTDWDCVLLVDKKNQYYLTGTMQDGVFALTRNGNYAFFARISYERAILECPLTQIYPMASYKDVMAKTGVFKRVYIETDVMPYGMLTRLKKHAPLEEVFSIEPFIRRLRAVKNTAELACMRESGRQHMVLMEDIIPQMLTEGISEAAFTAGLYTRMVELGYHGVARYAMFQMEQVAGQIGFGENSLYPTSFDGPGGMKGLHPASPILGDRERFLRKGDLVFVDIGYGVDGYHTDRTQVYMFGGTPSEETVLAHRECLRIQREIALMLAPGQIPADIYETVTAKLDNGFLENFMGYGSRRARFLGHGVGLMIDEYPVLAKGFTDPLEANMAIAVEPKKGVPGVGMVGLEDTYIVTENGGECITGGEKEIIIV